MSMTAEHFEILWDVR